MTTDDPAARIPTHVIRNDRGERCPVCDGWHEHVHQYDAKGEIPCRYDEGYGRGK